MRHRLDQFFRQLHLAGGIVKWAIISRLARLAALFRSPRQILSSWPEVPALSPRIAIFMHFDRRGRVSPTAIFYIKELIAGGYCVVFVTNPGRLTPEGEAELRKLCVAIFIGRNIGYDFGAWREMIETFQLPTPETRELIIVNDSMYGPLRNLDVTGHLGRSD